MTSSWSSSSSSVHSSSGQTTCSSGSARRMIGSTYSCGVLGSADKNTESSDIINDDLGGLEGEEVAIGSAEMSGDSSVGSGGRAGVSALRGRLGGSWANEISAGWKREAGWVDGVDAESEKSETWNDTVCKFIRYVKWAEFYNIKIRFFELVRYANWFAFLYKTQNEIWGLSTCKLVHLSG